MMPLRKKIEVKCSVTSSSNVLHWSVIYMQEHIPGGSLCKMNSVFLLFAPRWSLSKIELTTFQSCEIMSMIIINYSAVFLYLMNYYL